MSPLRFAAPKERRVAVITGGARGIGAACALRIAAEGRDIVIADIDPSGSEVARQVEAMGTGRLAAGRERLGQRALFVPTDVTSEAAVRSLVAQTVAEFGRLDVLVCCAGVLGTEAPFHEQPAGQLDRVLRINLYGVYYAHQAAIPAMLERGWGRCVTITSGARHGATNQVPYGVSKGAVYALAGALGNAYARQGVFVNGVEPGRALTQMVVPRFSTEHLADPGTPIGRYADPEEIAEVVEFLCSERNTYTTGSVWSVKGGTG
jgi:NAD(P)-dependent dehydrogenase (short-subunit alcohol dehydrogenase family)